MGRAQHTGGIFMSSKPSYVLAAEPEVDLAIVEAMLQELEDYLIKDELYRTVVVRIPGNDQSLKMTGGDLLTRLHRLDSIHGQLSPELQARVEAADQAARSTTYSLRTRFHDRLKREIKARMDSLKWFLDDCAQDPRRCRAEFPFEIRNRQRIEEALKELGDEIPEELRDGLRRIDQRIRMMTRGSDFIWDERLKPAFPPQPYWYLYVSP
jgi:hypothetical protein